MSNDLDKFKHSKRLLKDENAIKKQLKIAKANTHFPEENKVVKEPHRLSKHHAMDCGNPECFVCGNPRKTHKDKLTAQEKRLFQDMEQVPAKPPNGLPNDQDN